MDDHVTISSERRRPNAGWIDNPRICDRCLEQRAGNPVDKRVQILEPARRPDLTCLWDTVGVLEVIQLIDLWQPAREILPEVEDTVDGNIQVSTDRSYSESPVRR